MQRILPMTSEASGPELGEASPKEYVQGRATANGSTTVIVAALHNDNLLIRRFNYLGSFEAVKV